MQYRYSSGMVQDLPRIRTARAQDVAAVLKLAAAGGNGLTNLPPDHGALAKRIAASERALVDPEVRNDGSAVLLVAEYQTEIVATGMIFARVGAEWPFYSYRLTRQTNLSRAMGRSKAQRLLNLVNDFDGETEVGGLFVDPSRRGLALGRLMARARYLFIAQHRDWYGHRVIAELRGYQDADGRAPVWEAIGRHFYDMDFHEADRTGALHGNQFIADLGPRYPIYVSMLPADAQAAFNQPHDDGRPARDMLLTEGFRDEGYVDIFDGGPTLVADIDMVRTIRSSETAMISAIGAGPTEVIATAGLAGEFRVAAGSIAAMGDTFTIDPVLAASLAVEPGDTIRYAPA